MRIEMKATLREAYFSADNDTPSVVLSGVVVGNKERGETYGPVDITVRGTGVPLDGLVIGEEYQVWVMKGVDRVEEETREE